MSSVFRRSSILATLLLLSLSVTRSPAQAAQTPLDRQLSRIDFAISGVGEFTRTVSGQNFQGTTLAQPKVAVTQQASNTLAAVVTLRYTRSPFVGFEANYGYARYTQNFISNPNYIAGGAQSRATEYTFGYVVHPSTIFGVQPFASVGVGAIGFTPTAGGGQGLPQQARAAYYYSVGAEEMISTHLGLRAQFRQLFYVAPDFGQNYLTINQRTITSEPAIGVFARF